MNIYIGNLDFKVDEIEVIKLFALYGDVTTVKLIRDKDTGSSKGFGFVEMPKEEDARRAIDNLNGKEVRGRNIKVNDADENKKESDDRYPADSRNKKPYDSNRPRKYPPSDRNKRYSNDRSGRSDQRTYRDDNPKPVKKFRKRINRNTPPDKTD